MVSGHLQCKDSLAWIQSFTVSPPSIPCYRGLVAITERYFALNYFDHNLSGAQADQDVLKDLMREKLPRLHRHFAHLNVDILSITLNWFLALFFDAVPFLVRTPFYYPVTGSSCCGPSHFFDAIPFLVCMLTHNSRAAPAAVTDRQRSSCAAGLTNGVITTVLYNFCIPFQLHRHVSKPSTVLLPIFPCCTHSMSYLHIHASILLYYYLHMIVFKIIK